MRGREAASANLFSYVRLEERVRADHPLRPIRALANEVPARLNERFEGLYLGMGRPSIPPEMLLRATLLQAFFSVSSERIELAPSPALDLKLGSVDEETDGEEPVQRRADHRHPEGAASRAAGG